MKRQDKQEAKELYAQLRSFSLERLWTVEVPLFDKADSRQRIQTVALIRAVGAVFAEFATLEQKAAARQWLRCLLGDPEEKVRRYAITALPKLLPTPEDETALLEIFRTTTSDRERQFTARALEKFAGAAALAQIQAGDTGAFRPAEQRLRAGLARTQEPSVIRMDATLENILGIRIRLRCRRGLEEVLREEARTRSHERWQVVETRIGCVIIEALAPFSLADIHQMRCFHEAGFELGKVRGQDRAAYIETAAQAIVSAQSQRIMKAFTGGSIRYRLEFDAKGHQRGLVRDLAARAYALCPEILNDASLAPWTVAFCPEGRDDSIELRPRISPDPRLYFRLEDVPAASHPPLAACMARLAGQARDDLVWDPFCGSGLELIERALLGRARRVCGTDLSAEAIAIAQKNFAAANVRVEKAVFSCCDFRDFAQVEGLGPQSVNLVITNPPMGKRVPIADLRQLIDDLFRVADIVLKPGGRLLFANPFRMESPQPSLKLEYRQVVDFSGFDCRLERYRKAAS